MLTSKRPGGVSKKQTPKPLGFLLVSFTTVQQGGLFHLRRTHPATLTHWSSPPERPASNPASVQMAEPEESGAMVGALPREHLAGGCGQSQGPPVASDMIAQKETLADWPNFGDPPTKFREWH